MGNGVVFTAIIQNRCLWPCFLGSHDFWIFVHALINFGTYYFLHNFVIGTKRVKQQSVPKSCHFSDAEVLFRSKQNVEH